MSDDFDVTTLAEYLHLAPPQVARLVDRGKLPGRKVQGQWRFSQAEINLWLEERIGLSDAEELVEMESMLRPATEAHQEAVPSIAALLPPEAIAVPLEARTRGSVITSMVDLAAGTGLLWDAEKMADAVRTREQMLSTALESGVALLHPRRPMPTILGQSFLAFGRTARGIPFGGDHGKLTDLFFLICSTEDRGHLQVLARLSRLLARPGFLKELRAVPDAAAARQWIERSEAELERTG